MKQIFFLTLLVFSIFACKSNKSLAQGGQSYTMEVLIKPIESDVSEKGDSLRLVMNFAVGKDGSVSNPKIIRSSGDQRLDAEAIRVINASPNLESAIQSLNRLK